MVSIVVPFFGVASFIPRLLKGNPVLADIEGPRAGFTLRVLRILGTLKTRTSETLSPKPLNA